MANKKALLKHIKEHVMYPAIKAEIVETCNKMADLAQKDRKWLERTLPELEFKSAEEVIEALGWR